MKCVVALFLAVCALLAASAQGQQQAKSFSSVGEALVSTPQLSILTTLAKASGLTVPPEAAWTIFAPNDDAFKKGYLEKKTGLSVADLQKLENKEKLKQFLKYHIVPSRLPQAAAPATAQAAPQPAPQAAPQPAPQPAVAQASAQSTAQTTGKSFSLVKTGLFGKHVSISLGRRLLQDFPENPLRAAQLQNDQKLYTALPGAAPLLVDAKDRDDIEVVPSDDDKAEDADIVVADIQAGKSVIHIIDEVLVPASLRKQ